MQISKNKVVSLDYTLKDDNGKIIDTSEEDSVMVDANHPLAGMQLNFDVKVVDIREATKEEISHGHAHGPDGQHHD